MDLEDIERVRADLKFRGMYLFSKLKVPLEARVSLWIKQC